ncbi:MAG: 4-(cytidine 5'-diphospho)-2-C-methyl-D-erythritol kinase [Chloroflexi bacterium]|nr:4-(cytidine 5'-diphospho)-2-C-methyl-D-erythritol kinase [Chloroflexota bacterium]
MLELKAYAKVNLTLEVLGKRDDGYHDIVSIMQTVGLSDTVTLEEADGTTLDCDVPELSGPDNLALKAAQLIAHETGGGKGVAIGLQKGIPVTAGLGGGSSDAAAVLRGLNRLWKLGLSVHELQALGAKLGSDVPFFIQGGTAMAQGRGEAIRPMPKADVNWMVVLTPNIDVSAKTASLYGKLGRNDFTKGMLTRKLEARIRGGGDVPAQFLFNTFDAIAFGAFPGLEKCWKTFESVGAREVHLAGSGPSMFALVSQREVGSAMALLLTHSYGWKASLVEAVWPSEDV